MARIGSVRSLKSRDHALASHALHLKRRHGGDHDTYGPRCAPSTRRARRISVDASIFCKGDWRCVTRPRGESYCSVVAAISNDQRRERTGDPKGRCGLGTAEGMSEPCMLGFVRDTSPRTPPFPWKRDVHTTHSRDGWHGTWVPAFAGMTRWGARIFVRIPSPSSSRHTSGSTVLSTHARADGRLRRRVSCGAEYDEKYLSDRAHLAITNGAGRHAWEHRL